MIKRVLNAETKEVLMEMSLESDDPQIWARALKAYVWDVEIELVDVEGKDDQSKEFEQADASKVKSFWTATKSWFTSFFEKKQEE